MATSDASEARKPQREDAAPWPSGEPAASEEKSGRVPGASEEDMRSLEASLRLHLHEWGPVLAAGQRLLVWERPLPSLATAAALHGTFWVFSSLSPRPLFLLSLVLMCLLGIDWWKPWLLAQFKGASRGEPSSESEALPAVGGGGNRLLSVSELCHYMAESWFTFRQYILEVQQYKKQNPGKFCAAVCSCCAVLTVLGYYIPGIMICYIILLSVLLWPLVVYRELIQRMYTALEPVLMKLDYSMKGERLPRSHKKRQVKEPEGEELMAETDSESEIELSGFSPKLDVRITALALSITDSELSDEEASILESGGFSVSRATTPQLTDVSEDLDQPSMATEDVPPTKEPSGPPGWLGPHASDASESPADELHSSQHESLALNPEDLLPTLASPLHFVNTHFNGKSLPPGLESEVHPPSAEMVSRAVSVLAQRPASPGAATGLAVSDAQEPEGDVEDFELLEQGELDLMQEEFEEAEKLLPAASISLPAAATQPDQEKPSSEGM